MTPPGDKFAILKDYFGYTTFRPGQEEAIDAVMAGRDVLAVMPTGAGKSLCYEIPAMLLDGLTVVISPLISLMKDQVQSLRDAGIPAGCLNSSITGAEYRDTMIGLERGETKLLYLAPERLRNQSLGEAACGRDIPLVVVDEAHCLSQWGHDFRPGYMDIAAAIRTLRKRPVTAAFTATATPRVREDIAGLLRLKDPEEPGGTFYINTGFDRPNLYFEVQRPPDKRAALRECLRERAGKSGIIYCSTRKNVDEVYELLVSEGLQAARYHAGMSDAERRQNQDDFIYDRAPVIAATNAFGMGIDKSNVGFVIHYNMPQNIESYYQEAGRAGRDGAPADCILFYSGQDVRIHEFLLTRRNEEEGEASPEVLAHKRELLRQMTFYSTGNECLRRRLLSYFGEEAPDYCGNCSNCLMEYDETDVTLEARKIISCVYRLRERGKVFGKTMIIDILQGKRTTKITSMDLQTLSTWGIMKADAPQRIRAVMDFLIKEGYLAQEGDEYPVILWGRRAGPFIKAGEPLKMMLPREKAPPPPPEPERRRRGGYGAPASSGPFDTALYEKLRGLRKLIAGDERIPAYIVFTDACLIDMCQRKPRTLEAFSLVNGVGKVKRDKYGPRFLQVIQDHAAS